MAKIKPKRNMRAVGQSQHTTEATSRDKFAQVEALAKTSNQKAPTGGRICPQLTCTITPEDKSILNELTLYLSNKAGRVLNASNVIRSLIRYGNNHRDKLEM